RASGPATTRSPTTRKPPTTSASTATTSQSVAVRRASRSVRGTTSKSKQYAPVSGWGCNFDGRLRAPVFLHRACSHYVCKRERALVPEAGDTRISSEAEDFAVSDACRRRRRTCAQRGAACADVERHALRPPQPRRGSRQ